MLQPRYRLNLSNYLKPQKDNPRGIANIAELTFVRQEFIDLCIDNLKKHRSTPQSMSLMPKIIGNAHTSVLNGVGTFLGNKKKKSSAGSILELAEQKHALLTLYFTDLVLYKDQVTEKGLDASGSPQIDRYTHMEHIEVRGLKI